MGFRSGRASSLGYRNIKYIQEAAIDCQWPNLSVVASKGLELLGATNAVSVALGLLSGATLAVWLVEEVAKAASRLVALSNIDTVAVLVVVAVVLAVVQGGGPGYVDLSLVVVAA